MTNFARKWLNKIIIIVFLTFVLFLISIGSSHFSIHRVIGDSMSPTLKDGDIILINNKIRNFQNGNIVLFCSNKTPKMMIKRIFGSHSDTLVIERDQIKVMGITEHISRLQNAYANDLLTNSQDNTLSFSVNQSYSCLTITHMPTIDNLYFYTQIIPVQSFFVLGDNIPTSNDSRHFGLVSENEIKGVFVHKLSFLTNPN